MFDIMFMRQKRNEPARLIWIAPHGPFIRSDQSSNCRTVRAQSHLIVSGGGPKMAEWEVVFSAGSELKLVISQAIDPIWL